jgi:hypothetical protein
MGSCKEIVLGTRSGFESLIRFRSDIAFVGGGFGIDPIFFPFRFVPAELLFAFALCFDDIG